jgi:hypothetical protein
LKTLLVILIALTGNMASSKVIGGPFDKKVINQLEVRSNLMSKPNRDDNTLRYLAARTGWVKMSSSVQVNGTNDLALKYILIGGTYGRVGENTYSNFPNGKGFRPMPGITGVDIKAINKFGLLKEATITYNCWDVSQLQELEMLFMRPGFSVLLEWGHSTYYTSDTNIETVPQTVKSFFTVGTSKEKLYEEIEGLKEKSGYNYDAIYGFIKNFSWSFRADGGYDCVTTLTSIGEIIESLQIDIDNPLAQGGTAEETSAKSEEVITSAKKQADALKKNPKEIAEEPTPLEYIVIGDSQTPYIVQHSRTAKLINKTDGIPYLHKSGWNFNQLLDAVQIYPVSDKVKGVVVCIGTNGGFNKNDKILVLKAALNRVFPNASKLAFVGGSWGWGYNTDKNEITFVTAAVYSSLYNAAGFFVIPEAIGDMTFLTNIFAGAPHNGEIPSYKAIGASVDKYFS